MTFSIIVAWIAFVFTSILLVPIASVAFSKHSRLTINAYIFLVIWLVSGVYLFG